MTTAHTPLIEAASAVLEHAPAKRLKIVVLNKTLFYLDLCGLRDLGHTITKSTYLAFPKGPVVTGYKKRLVKALEQSGVAKQTASGDAKPVELINPITTFVHLSEIELAYASAVVSKLGKHTSANLSEWSHSNLGWKAAFDSGNALGKPPAVINMHLAMQQICEDDTWLTAPADELIVNAVKAVETDEVEAW